MERETSGVGTGQESPSRKRVRLGLDEGETSFQLQDDPLLTFPSAPDMGIPLSLLLQPFTPELEQKLRVSMPHEQIPLSLLLRPFAPELEQKLRATMPTEELSAREQIAAGLADIFRGQGQFLNAVAQLLLEADNTESRMAAACEEAYSQGLAAAKIEGSNRLSADLEELAKMREVADQRDLEARQALAALDRDLAEARSSLAALQEECRDLEKSKAALYV